MVTRQASSFQAAPLSFSLLLQKALRLAGRLPTGAAGHLEQGLLRLKLGLHTLAPSSLFRRAL